LKLQLDPDHHGKFGLFHDCQKIQSAVLHLKKKKKKKGQQSHQPHQKVESLIVQKIN
jgi:hypothetical protein